MSNKTKNSIEEYLEYLTTQLHGLEDCESVTEIDLRICENKEFLETIMKKRMSEIAAIHTLQLRYDYARKFIINGGKTVLGIYRMIGEIIDEDEYQIIKKRYYKQMIYLEKILKAMQD